MFFRPKDNPDSKARPTPPWFKFLVLGFLAYALVTHFAHRNIVSTGDIKKDALNAARDFAFPEGLQGVSWSDEAVFTKEAASGNKAFCGEKVKVTYRTWTKDNKAIEDVTEPREITLGAAEVLPALSQVAVGLAPGVKRSFYAGPAFGYDNDYGKNFTVPGNSIIRGEVWVTDIAPRPELVLPLHATTLRKGEGNAVCGQEITLRLNVWDANGTRLDALHGAPITYRMGENTLPRGLVIGLAGASGSQVEGIGLGEIRTIVVPPPLLGFEAKPEKDAADNLSVIAWPKTGVLIVDAERIENPKVPVATPKPSVEIPAQNRPTKP